MSDSEIISGSIDLKISEDCDDHHSLMVHFRNAVVGPWVNEEREYWEMLQEELLECPKEYLWESFRRACE